MMGYVCTDNPYKHLLLEELWKLMKCYSSDEAARRFCEKHRCARGRNIGDWKFFFSVPGKGDVLELGAGFGDDTIDLAGMATRLISLVPDITNALILEKHLCEKNVSNTEIAVVKDITCLPLSDNSLAAIAMEDAAAAGFAVTNGNFPSTAAEWKRVLSPGGVVFLGLGNSFDRLLGLHFLRSKIHPRNYPESLNRYVKRATGGPRSSILGLRRTIRCMVQQGFDGPTIFCPLPDEKRCEVVIPAEDPRVVLYFLNNLIRKNSLTVRAAIAASSVLVKLNLFRALLPYYFLTFRLADKDLSRAGEDLFFRWI